MFLENGTILKIFVIKIIFINLTNFNFNLPINGFLKSRLFYIFISIVSIFKLPSIIYKLKPDYFIAHLIVVPVLFISMFYSKKQNLF